MANAVCRLLVASPWSYTSSGTEPIKPRRRDPLSDRPTQISHGGEHRRLWQSAARLVLTAPSCVVLVLNMEEPNFLYCRVRDSRWSTHEYHIGEVPVLPECTTTRNILIQQMVAVGGKLCFHEKGKLGVIDFSPSSTTTPEFTYLDYPRIGFPEGSNCNTEFHVESRGELFNVTVFCKGFNPAEILTVGVYRVDRKVDGLGDRVVLLSDVNTQVLCSASKYGLKGNRVYFNYNVTGEPDGGPMCVYDLDDQSLETVQPCKGVTELMRNPFWVLPTGQDCVISE